MTTKKIIPLYPLLLGLSPIVGLIAHNRTEMVLTDGIRAILFSGILAIIVLLITRLIFTNAHKSALITTFFFLLIFSYGHLNFLLRNTYLFDLELGRHRVLIPVYLLISTLGIWLLARSRRDLLPLSITFAIISIFLIGVPILQIAYSTSLAYFEANERNKQLMEELPVALPQDKTPPDIYYLLLDGYPRSDFIAQFFGVDITPFLNDLAARGFYIVKCAQSNYTDTRFSMAATLNMRYLDRGTGEPEVMLSGTELNNLIQYGEVQRNFAALGYKIITFESGYKWLKWAESDMHLDPAKSRAVRTFLSLEINDFEYLFLNTTVLKIILDLPFILDSEQARFINEMINSPRTSHRDRVLYTLEHLPAVSETIPGPRFVYAHLVFPHPPFVVDANGTPLRNTPPDELKAYGDQIIYLNKRLIQILDQILKKPGPRPIIILQSDHGATIDYEKHGIDKIYRLGILNAFNFPDFPPSKLSATLTPVNTFRLIFDYYFNGHYGLLEDKSIIGRQSPFTTLECNIR